MIIEGSFLVSEQTSTPVSTVRPIFLSDSDSYFCPIRIGIGIGGVCQCLHITIQPIKSERKSESETKNRTVSGNKPLLLTLLLL